MTWFDICIFIVTAYCIFKGYKTGLVKQLATLAGLVAGAVLSGQISTIIRPLIQGKTESSDYILEPLSYILAFAIIMLAFYLLGTLVQGILEAAKMGTLNRLAGIVLCLTKWMFAISIVLNLLIKVDTNRIIISHETEARSKTYKYVQPLAPYLVPYLKFGLDKE
ncbi:CvpA family protein [Dysgonomonas macrotermitis]|uniref:Uncharacterized membrane protein, required for colicin V production n=1 Tax=Dysgonomonas macrotermitis TaxID=1346286 RepID=A0A1M5CZF7_9BACT|nr:CvpA family protein [Dysgonomonas macrotermitis]SHF60015.1 Uncharacterized membrane protein, required for colicin V production [Dysgonomonas macrotermitis]